jgi:hypothetical protein
VNPQIRQSPTSKRAVVRACKRTHSRLNASHGVCVSGRAMDKLMCMAYPGICLVNSTKTKHVSGNNLNLLSQAPEATQKNGA